MNIFRQFQSGLKKTSNFLSANIVSALKSKEIDRETLDEIEATLLSSDIGIEVTNQLIKKIETAKISNPEDSNFILNVLANELESILKPREQDLFTSEDNQPTILLFIGVNGSGKTTTIGKLINIIAKDKKILVAACDTFRAAATDQLKEWVIKQGADFHQGVLEQDPASVAYSACEKARKDQFDYVIIDTAGRLSNNTNLLNQLVKIKSVISKAINADDIRTILVLDGTNGSNMVNQVETFGKSMNVSGLIITKIDGTAKGGALISIAKKYEIPIHFVGLGEKVNDLFEFNAKKFSHSMLGIDN
ncbi:signal recognition particle-docking protein FtsY [Alphaproteobacteria bacterium]|jgi:fused signal recognition particle receptor|nr:signal recognition particle-docking protein FtsY [Alphaproteobacteria bacterium]